MIRVLVVEDDKYLNKLICDYLSLEGFQVSSALDGESAWKILQDSTTEFDAVTVDLLLPRMMGAELFSKINEDTRLSPLKKIGISGVYKDPADQERVCSLHQLSAYLLKPFDLSELAAQLRGESPPSSSEKLQGSGDLAQTPLERLFFQAYCRAFTGSLNLKWQDSDRKIFFLNGHPVSASSSSLSENLGAFLIQEALIDSEQREEISKQMAEKAQYFGEALLELGILLKSELYQALRKHTYQILMNSFSTRQGQYSFESLEELPSHLPHIEFNPFLLMLEAQKRQISAAALEELFQIKAKDFPARGPRFFQLLPSCNPSLELQKHFEIWPPELSLSDWFNKIGIENRESAQRTLYLFETLGVLGWQSEPPESNERPEQVFQFEEQRAQENQEHDRKTSEKIREVYMDALNQNFFELLRVSEEASREEIEEKYRELRFEAHPDRFLGKLRGETSRILQDYLTRLDKAYQCLIDDDRRQEYLARVSRSSEDSAADSKRYLQAQDLFHQAQRELAKEKFTEAKLLFDRAYASWAAGIEYRLFSIYTDFRSKASAKLSEKQAQLNRLKEVCLQNPHLETGFLLLGHAHRHLNQVSAAREAYQKALQISPDLEEALNALSRLAEKERKHFQFKLPKILSKKILKRALVIALLTAAFVPLYRLQKSFQSEDAAVIRPDPAMLREHFQTNRIEIKAQFAQIQVKSGEVRGLPDAVVRHRCQRSLLLLEVYGAERLFVIEENHGLSAFCTRDQFRRY
ncbi:MAG: response regulator [Bradymonadales bacterium]|nr:MAG: response regulator [Bradymonadales bacterium]